MGFLAKLFGKSGECPGCHEPGARVSFFGASCIWPGCAFYDADYAAQVIRGRSVHWSQVPPVEFDDPVEIEYTNFRGEQKTFTAEGRSLRVRGRHLSACVAPSGWRIALKLDRIGNLDAIKPAVAQAHAAREGVTGHAAYVINFHRRRGTTSPLYESLRAKHPNI